MKQSDAVQFLYRDLQVVTTDLELDNYDQVFEEEMQEYFPFNDVTMEWLVRLYQSEKYGCFGEEQLNFYFEKEHPFLFIRDMAHMNSWNRGERRADRRDHITGLMFSGNPEFALEATLCLCRPSLINEETSQWFDFKQAMNNLEKAPISDMRLQAWKACGLCYLYFYLSGDGQSIRQEELVELLSPYQQAIDMVLASEESDLKKECQKLKNLMKLDKTQTLMDGLHC